MQVEIELGLHAGEAAHIDDAAENRGRFHGLHDDRPGQHVDDEIDAFAAGGGQHRIGPGRIARIEGEVGAELLQACAPRLVGRRADHQFGAHELCDLQAHQPDTGARPLDHHALARFEPAAGDERVVQREKRDRQRRRVFEAQALRNRVDASPVGDGVFGIATGAGAHDAFARLVLLNFGAGFDHLAGPFEPDRRADPAMAAMTALHSASVSVAVCHAPPTPCQSQ